MPESLVTDASDTLMTRGTKTFAGMHIVIDLYGAQHLHDIEYIERVMRECVSACGATLLHMHLHHFSPNEGVTGVAVLAESHISIHTWPEYNFAAFDVFMCGGSAPELAVEILKTRFCCHSSEVKLFQRGGQINSLADGQ